MKKRLAALLLVFVLCLSALPGTAFARETAFYSPLPQRFDYNALRLNGSCVAELDAACSSALALLSSGTVSDSELFEAWNRMISLKNDVELQYVLTTIRYYQNPGAYSQAYADIVSGRNSSAGKLLSTQQALLSDERYGPQLQAYIGYRQTASILNDQVPDQQLLSMLQAENDLVIRYQQAVREDPAQVVNGKSWTLQSAHNAYLADPDSGGEYLEIYYHLYAQRNEKLGQIYLELIDLRNRIAQRYGYADFAEYAHSTQYGRDYTLPEKAVFREEVRQYLLPLFRTLSLSVHCGVFANGTEYGSLEQDALLDAIAPNMSRLSSELADAFSYMRDCHLIDASLSSTKLNSTFTISLPQYGTAYVNCRRRGSNQDLFDVIHEFGHFHAFTRGIQTLCYDTLEVHSQGMEMLFLGAADDLFGARAQSQSGFELYQTLRVVMAGCVYDELQSYAYASEDLTLDDLNRKSAELMEAYGLEPTGPAGVDYSWVEVGHTFESPMYYISYVTSAFTALGFYLTARTEGTDAAADRYLNYVLMSLNALGYRGPLIICEMEDPFRPGTVGPFSRRLTECIYSQLCGVPYADTQGSWAESDIVLLYLLGILNGTSDTTFSPDSTLTRAMAVTALYRAVGEPDSTVDASAVFSDVPSDSWYTEAVGWAIEAGVTDGTSETTFSPTKPVNCQEFAAMLYRQRFGAGYDYGDEPAPEGGAVWAADALNWSRDEAVFRSESGAAIAPTAALSRAEFAAALVGAIYD